MRPRSLLLAVLLGSIAVPAYALAPDRSPGYALPRYPGLYGQISFGQDDFDQSWQQDGSKSNSATPQTPDTQLPTRGADVDLQWFFPLFEDSKLPFISNRLHTARLTLRYRDLDTQGGLARFVDDTSDDARTDADDLSRSGSGIGDPSFEFGTVVLGSPDWRKGERSRYSLTTLLGTTLPVGIYDRNAPVSAGNNTLSWHLRLLGHAQPWRGGLLEGGVRREQFLHNEDPAFGALHPDKQGSQTSAHISVAQRLPGALWLGAGYYWMRGDANVYRNPRFAPNPPTAPTTVPASDNFPTRGSYRDDGTGRQDATLHLQWFAHPRVIVGAQYLQPLSGKSGSFTLPYTNRQPAGCTPGGTGCMTTAGDSITVDGMGAARQSAASQWRLTVQYQFGLGDPFLCTGCSRE